jgi:amino acid adenylation domain-containing protein
VNTPELLTHLHDLGVKLWSDGQRLRLNAPTGVLTPTLREQVSARKAEILSFIEQAARTAAAVPAAVPPLVPQPPESRGTAPPLSFAQQRLWFIDQLEPGSSAYTIAAALSLEGRLDEAALEGALSAIVARHETLRTSFEALSAGPIQVIEPAVPLRLPVVDLAGLPQGERGPVAERWLAEEARRPFDLSRGSLLRVLLLRLAQEEHILLLLMHHIVSDGWSMGVLIREASVLYTAFQEGRSPALAELPIQYVDFAVWQRERLQGEVLERQLDWWKSHLAGAPSVLELPADRPRSAVRSTRGGRVALSVEPEVALELAALSRREGATLFMTYLAAFEMLLSRLSGRTDLVVGTPIAGRVRPELEDLIGLFVNTLALRGELSGDPTFFELLARVRSSALGAYAHQELPFEKLVEELAPERNLTHTPLFQVLFVFQNAPTGVLALPGLRWRRLEVDAGSAKFDLTLTLFEGDGGVAGGLSFHRDLFDEPTVRRWAGHLQVLLEGIVLEPQARLSERDLLASSERHQVLLGWNDTARGPVTRTVHGLFTAQAQRSPQAVALRYEGEDLSFVELDRRSNQLARFLRGYGVGPDVLVGLCLERSLEMVVGLLGILKAGGAFIPLDPGYPPERLAYMLEDGGAPVLLSHSSLLDRLPRGVSEQVLLDADWERIAELSAAELDVAVDTDHLACVLYTSGSTGRPKGVMDPHRSVANQILWLQSTYCLDGTDRVLQKTPISWDVSLWELFWPLTSGATLVLARPGGHQDPAYMAATLAQEGITTVHFVPSMLRIFLDMVDAQSFPSLRRVVSSGEALTLDLEEKFYSSFRVDLNNMYGPGESARASLWRCERGNTRAVAPIGRPTHNVELYVLDRALEPAPIGVAGELYVGGQSLARGYYRRPDLTAEKFLPHPFGDEPSLRLYRTGDLCRTLPDGTLEFLGRIDHQVKIRGVRIELGEIESVLGQHPRLADAVVVARPVGSGEKRLAAYVVPEGGLDAVGIEELREHLRSKLPDYMVPESWVFLAALPLAPNGKADRERLPEPQWVSSQRGYVAPRNAVEELLATVWAELLGLERVGVQDGFFELGGNSLLATQVASRVRSMFRVELPLRTVFARPTLAELAEDVAELLRREAGSAAPPLLPVPRTGALPLSFAQQRLWFIHQLDPGSSSYNVPRAVRLVGTLQPAALEAALGEVVRRHEVLRTTFPTIDGQPAQSISPPWPLALPRVDLSGLPEGPRGAEAARLARQEARQPFDLGRGPLLRSFLMREGTEDHTLLLTLHHIVSDGWSTGVLVREVTALYSAFLAGQPSPLPELPVQYADFAHWQRSWLSGEVLEEQLSYWRRQLAGLPDGLDLPLDRPRPALPALAGGLRSHTFPDELRRAIHRLGRERGATSFMVLLGAFATFLSRITGQTDIVTGSPIANRNRLEIEGLIGFFVNTLVLRIETSGSPTFSELLARVREVALGASVHQDLPFERLVDELAPQRNLGRTPLFQVLFVVQNAPTAALTLPGLSLQSLPGDTRSSNFDLTLSLSEAGGALQANLEYRTALFDATTIERFLRHFETLLTHLVQEPEGRVTELPIFTPIERQQIREWNTTPPAPASDLLHRRFEDQAARTPEAVALVFDDREMTYAELNARANQLGYALRQRGVGVGTFVGICVERSFELVIALLGSLKAGACYVPLDPAYPSERWARILEDSGIRVLVTQESLLPLLPEPDWEVLCVDRDRHLLDACSTEDPPPASAPDDLFYLIYTSGSTGRPKGVAVFQSAVLNLFDWYIAAFGLRADDSFLLIGSIGFDMTQKTVFAPLLLGGRLVIPQPGPYDPAVHVASVERHRITRLNCTPSTFYPMIEQAEDFPRLASLRGLSLGGEPISLARLERWRTSPWCRAYVLNTYGPTECTDLTSWHRLEPPGERNVVPIGRPLTGVQVWVLSRELVPVPVGVTGHLCASGNVSPGYLGQPAMTAEKFLPNPFSEMPGERMYWLGDLGRWLPTGELEYLGRADFQIKLRGFRIEPGEIEAALSQHPSVREVVVLARGEESRRLVAWLGVGSGPAPTTEELRTFLEPLLPEYMIPSVFVPMEALPQTPNGKIDRRALPEPDAASRPDLGAEYVAPRTLEETALAEVWSEVLGVDRVGVHDNFFALGGDSIRSVRVVSLAKARGLRFALPQLFQHQTIAQLAPHRLTEPVASPAVSAASGSLAQLTMAERSALAPGVEDAYPVSALQLGMLFHSDYFASVGDGATALYHLVSTVRLSRVLDTAVLQAAAAKLAERHPVLRTSFDLVGFSRPLQLVHRAVEVPVTEEDLGGLGVEEREAAVARRFEAEKARRFEMDRPPLLRFHVQHLGAGETQLFWAVHHVILDGWSLAVLLSELFQLCRVEPEVASLPPAPLSTFREFIALEREVLESEEARSYWMNRLRDAEPARLLPWHSAGGVDRTPVTVPLPDAVLAGLRNLAVAAGVPLKNVFLASHVWFVGRITGTREVTTGLVSNGRPEASDADRILGLFLNTVPLYTTLPGGTWLDLVRQMFETEREILPFRRYPLSEIQRELGATQLFETSFNYINFYVLAEAQQEGGLQLGSARSFGVTNIPLTVDFVHDSARDAVRLNLQSDLGAVNQDQLRSMSDLFLRALTAMALTPRERYDVADLLSPAERQQILHEWNAPVLERPLESELVHGVFEHWVAVKPDSPALKWSRGQLTYRELDRWANRIARRLQASGARPEVTVGLYVERSPEMIASLLGIWKAGATYVPLDPAYPRERLLMMIEDVHMPLVLTQERLAHGMAGLVEQVITVESMGEAGPEDDANPPTGVVPNNLAYVIFTSGSTGRPKPVGVPHRGLTHHMAGTRQLLRMWEYADARVLQFSTLNFDGSLDQFTIGLLNGCCLVLREEEMWSAEELETRIAEHDLTIVDLSTGYWSEWVRARSAMAERAGGEPVRLVYLGGEAMMSEELAVWWRSPRNRNVRLLNAYGPTETVIVVSALEVTSPESAGEMFERVPIGRPFAERSLHVVDADWRLSPVGVSGELLIAGEHTLARGYLGRPDLTAERFLPDPFSPLPGARLYRTGDLGRYLPDGRREFLGRADDQVKVRGFRIELGEVEGALMEHPAIYRAVAVVHGKSGNNRRLVAYVTPIGDLSEAPAPEELRAFLRGKLPEPMVPSDVMVLERLPLTPSGKVDRKALPVPELSARRGAGAAQAPRSDVELELVAIWEELLGVSPIGVTDDFLELGGHSLLAVRLMARLEHVFGVKLPISALFEAPTVEHLAAVIQGREAPVRRTPLVRLHPGGTGRPLFVVHPVGGDVFAYVELARKLGADRPVYGLQAVAEGNGHQPGMEELAAQYLAAVREVQPEGPYLLAGWSLGAVIAYEMAQQIESSGGTVALLAMIDPSSPADGRSEGIDDSSLLAGFAADLVRLSGRPVPFGQEVLAGLDVDTGLDRLVELGRGEGVLPPDVDKPRLRERFDLFGRHVKALQSYVPRPYGGRVALFRASGSLAPGTTDPTWGWSALARAEAHLFEADHYSLLQRPALERLVEQLRSDLTAVESGAGGEV